MWIRKLSSFAILAVAILLPGCAPRPAEIARVGARVVTVDDFNVAARANWTQYPGNPAQARHLLLDDLVRRALLLSLAESRGMLRDSSTARYRRSIEEQVLTQALNERMVPRSIPVSDAEIATFYDWSAIRAHMQLIYCPDRASAEAAAAQLHAGRPFDEVERRYTPAGLLPPGGDLGEVAAGSLVDPLDTFVRETPVGRIEGPVEAPGEGWFVARVLSRHRVPPQAPLEVQRPQFADLLRQRKQRLISVRAFESLRAQYRVAREPGGPQAMFRVLNRPAPPNGGRATPLEPSPEERAMVVVRYVDAAGLPQIYTLGAALDDLHTADRERPSRTELPAIESWLEQQVIRRVVVLEARRRGLDRDPAFARTIDERVNNAILESIYALAVEEAAAASETDVQAAYARHAAQYRRLAAARLLHATLGDSAAISALIQHGAHAGSLRDAVKMAGVEARVVEARVTFPTTNPVWKALQADLLSMTQGEWTAPIRVKEGWRVVQLVDKQERSQAFEQLSPAIQQGLRQEALTLRREERLAALTDSLQRVVHPFAIREDALKRIPWPPPGVIE